MPARSVSRECDCEDCRTRQTFAQLFAAKQVILHHVPRPAWWSTEQHAMLHRIVSQANPGWSFGARALWLETLDALTHRAIFLPEVRAAVDNMFEEAVQQYLGLLEDYANLAFEELEHWERQIEEVRSQFVVTKPDEAASAN